MKIQRFERDKAVGAHNNTILASAFVPEGMSAPFDAAWGYLDNNSEMEAHAHKADEIYVVVKGAGSVMVGEQWRAVLPGDVIEIPSDAVHTMRCEDKGPLLWAALWWRK